MARLPTNIHLQIAQLTKTDVWHMDELLKVIKEEVEARELSESMKICQSRVPESTQRRASLPTASALMVRDGNPNCKMHCVYCKADHYSASCESVNTIPAQMEALRKGGHCFLCLAIGHHVAQCSSNRCCRKCNRKHHQSLCDQSINPKEQGPTVSGTVVKIQQ